MLEIKLQKYPSFANYHRFVAANVSFLKLCWDGDVPTYATNKKLKKKEFQATGENIKQIIVIQVTFILEIKLEKYIF